MKCNGCNQTRVSHIADGLYLCNKCEKEHEWFLVQDIETTEFKWKNETMAIVDEIIVETKANRKQV